MGATPPQALERVVPPWLGAKSLDLLTDSQTGHLPPQRLHQRTPVIRTRPGAQRPASRGETLFCHSSAPRAVLTAPVVQTDPRPCAHRAPNHPTLQGALNTDRAHRLPPITLLVFPPKPFMDTRARGTPVLHPWASQQSHPICPPTSPVTAARDQTPPAKTSELKTQCGEERNS